MSAFSDKLKNLRILKNVAQVDIATSIKTSERQYRRYEKAEQEPTLSTLINLADYFDVSLDYLVGRSDDPTRH